MLRKFWENSEKINLAWDADDGWHDQGPRRHGLTWHGVDAVALVVLDWQVDVGGGVSAHHQAGPVEPARLSGGVHDAWPKEKCDEKPEDKGQGGGDEDAVTKGAAAAARAESRLLNLDSTMAHHGSSVIVFALSML